MRILFVTDFFHPETNAAASRVFERAKYWVSWGHDVTVVTSVPNFPRGRVFPGYRNSWYQTEDIGGVRVIRVKTYMAENKGKWKRQLDLLSFLFTATPVATLHKQADVVVAASPNFFAGLAGCLAALLRGRPFVLEIGDLWPAFAVSLGTMWKSPTFWVLRQLEEFMYRRAAKIVCLTEGFRTEITGRGFDPSTVEVVLNGVELELFSPAAPAEPDVLPDMNQRFIVGYFGTQGLAHGLEFVLEVAEQMPDVAFLFVGDGAQHQALVDRRAERQIENVYFVPPQPRQLMPAVIGRCDVSLVALRDLPLLETAIPSKIFEAMAMGKPVLLAAPPGDASELLASWGCGVHVPAGDVKRMVEAIAELRDVPGLVEKLGQSGRQASPSFSREVQSRNLLDILLGVAAQ